MIMSACAGVFAPPACSALRTTMDLCAEAVRCAGEGSMTPNVAMSTWSFTALMTTLLWAWFPEGACVDCLPCSADVGV